MNCTVIEEAFNYTITDHLGSVRGQTHTYMDRKNLNKMKPIAILTLLFSILFCSCSSTPPEREDIIGVWVSDDGAKIQFNCDSSFRITNIPESIMISYHIDKILLSGFGLWSIEYSKTNHLWQIELSIQDYVGQMFIEKNPFANSRILSFFDKDYVEKNFYVSSNWLLSFFDQENGDYIFKKEIQ